MRKTCSIYREKTTVYCFLRSVIFAADDAFEACQCCVQIHVVSTVWLTCECNEPACSASCGLSPNPLHCSSRVVWLESKEQEMSQCGSYVNAMSLLTTPAVAFYRPCCSHYGECSIFSMTFGGGCSPFLALKSPHSRH